MHRLLAGLSDEEHRVGRRHQSHSGLLPTQQKLSSGRAGRLALTVGVVNNALRCRLEADLPGAIKSGDTVLVSVLRTTLSALAHAEAVDASVFHPDVTEVPRRELADDDVRGIVERERDELRTSADRMLRVGAPDRARDLVAQARLLDGYLADVECKADATAS